MCLNELVLTSIENFGSFVVNGRTLTKELYEKLYQAEVEKFYLDFDNNKKIPIMVVTLEDFTL